MNHEGTMVEFGSPIKNLLNRGYRVYNLYDLHGALKAKLVFDRVAQTITLYQNPGVVQLTPLPAGKFYSILQGINTSTRLTLRHSDKNISVQMECFDFQANLYIRG